jgi:hypothetical protein
MDVIQLLDVGRAPDGLAERVDDRLWVRGG